MVLMATLVTAQNELSLSWGWAKVDQNCLKTVSKAYQNCMKMIQKFLLFPKHMASFESVLPSLVRFWSANGPIMVQFGLHWVHFWSALVCFLSDFSLLFVRFLSTFVRFWFAFVLLLVCFWSAFGLLLVCLWSDFGLLLVCVWSAFGPLLVRF